MYYTDTHNNTATGSFKVTVEDTTPPTLILPADITAEATSSEGAAVTFNVSAADLVDGTVEVICSSVSGSTFPLGTTTVNCSATDAHGNKVTGSFYVTVQDTTPPKITIPSDIIAEATSASGAAVTFETSANDLVDGVVSVSCDTPSGSTFALGETIVTCTATDSHKNTSSKTFKITVQDTTAPEIAERDDITVEATSPAGAIVNFVEPDATDAVDGTFKATCKPASGSQLPLGDTTVTFTAIDKHGNIAEAVTFKFMLWIRQRLLLRIMKI